MVVNAIAKIGDVLVQLHVLRRTARAENTVAG
jgi:hypothetical protein